MRGILVDANVLVSFLTDRDPSQRKKASALFHAAAEREVTLVLHTVTIVELVYVLIHLYEEEPADVARDLAELLAMPGVVAAEAIAWSLVLERWPHPISSFGDAILAAAAQQGRHDAVATFDLGLRRQLRKQGSVAYWSE